jgi:aspartyl/asparaginyl beta-hydroxylase (cupin superfamily)
MTAGDPDRLVHLARERLEARDPAGARRLLDEAVRLRPRQVDLLLLLSVACRLQGDHAAALAATGAALKIDPYAFVAYLYRGITLEDLGRIPAAVEAYQSALGLAPPKDRLSPSLQKALEHAEQVVDGNSERLYRFLSDAVAEERARHPDADLRRFDECLAIFAGRARRYVHECALLYFPRLPALPFYDDELFPWLPRLEQATDMIRAELETVMQEDRAQFHPYIQYPEGAPVRQWHALNHSPDWSAFDFWRDGRRNEENCRRCPGTAALLDELPLAHQAGYGPNAMFSVLAPHTHIPPHTGSTNIRLIVHLPLILPEGCRYRVGNEHRDWKMGKAWVFDDSIEHEARNDSDETRVILMFDVWNPLLTEVERGLVTRIMAARQQFR